MQGVTGKTTRGMLRAALLLSAAAYMASGAAQAQSTTQVAGNRQEFDIPAQALTDALIQFGRQAGLKISVDAALVGGARSSGIQGSMPAAQALSSLLTGTGLTYRINGSMVTIERAPQADGAMQLGPVRVEGAADIAGAEGVAASDGAGLALIMTERTNALGAKYAMVGGKTAQALKDIPQSVTVITAQEIEDKNITTVTDALDQVTGIYVASYNARTPVFYSRGFLVENLTIDGGSPMQMHTGTQSIADGVGLPNLLAYDHVEVLRGADGLFSGTGDASGTVNLVRKRPTKEPQASFAIYAGSWNNYRGEADISTPLTKSGNLRARGVIGVQDADSYVTGAYNKDKFFYGIVEWDAGAHTTISVGASFDALDAQKYERSLAWRAGSKSTPENLPVYSKRVSWMPEWAYDKADTAQYFLRLDHSFSPDWNLTVNLTRNETTSDELYGYFSSINSDVADPTGLLMRWASHGYSNQNIADVTVRGKFQLFGQEQELVVGANYSHKHSNSTNPIGFISGVSLDDYMNYYRKTKPTAAEIATWTGYGEWGGVYGEDGWRATRYGGYATLGLRLASPFRVIVGGRLSRNENYSGQWTTKFVPYYAATYAFAHDWNAYASVAEIFQPLDDKVPVGEWNADASQIQWSDKPTTGTNYEAGIKGDLLGGNLHAAMSVFYIEKHNVYVDDEEQGQVVIDGYGSTYMQRVARIQTSKGVDFELRGALTPSLQIAAGYTFNVTKDKEVSEPILEWTPKHTARIWGTWQLPGEFDKLRLGGGVRVFGNSELRKGYALVGTSLDWAVLHNLTLGVNVDNLLNKTYRVSTSSAATYGNPRNFMITLRGRY